MKHLLILLIIPLFLVPLELKAQEVDPIGRYLDSWLSQCEEEPNDEEIAELLEYYLINPINLNDTSSMELFQLPFMDVFLAEAIRDRIRTHGEFLSIEEFLQMNLIDSSSLQLIIPFICAKPVDYQPREPLMDNIHQKITLGSRRRLGEDENYWGNHYMGSPYRLFFNYSLALNDKIEINFSGDKDVGEEFGGEHQPLGFDFYGYNLFLKDLGMVKKVVLGHFQTQFGQGLTLWNGFASFGSTLLRRNGVGIKKASAFNEDYFMNGIAIESRIMKQTTLSVFYSNSNRDATIPKNGGDSIIQSIYHSGYHRTANELSKKDQVNEQVIGYNLRYEIRRFSIGSTGYWQSFNKEIIPAQRVYNQYGFKGKENGVIGLDWNLLIGRNMLLYGEASMSKNRNSGITSGMDISLKPKTKIGLLFYSFDPEYNNFYANPHSKSSTFQGENGIRIHFCTLLPLGITLNAHANRFISDIIKYRTYSPSSGNELWIEAMKTIKDIADLQFQYRFYQYQRNTSTHTTYNYFLENYQRLSSNFLVSIHLSPNWNFDSRLYLTDFRIDEQKGSEQRGLLFYENISYRNKAKNLILSGRFSIFRGDSGADARISVYENNLLYESSLMAFYGPSERFSFMLRWKPFQSGLFELGLKYSVTKSHSSESSVGDVSVQVQAKF